LAAYPDFDSVVALIRAQRDGVLLADVETDLRLVRYAPGRIEFQPTDAAAPDLAQRLGQRLQAWTGQRWVVSVAAQGGALTRAEAQAVARETLEERALTLPAVQAVLAAFPGARIREVRMPVVEPPAPVADAADEVPDDWDPFDE